MKKETYYAKCRVFGEQDLYVYAEVTCKTYNNGENEYIFKEIFTKTRLAYDHFSGNDITKVLMIVPLRRPNELYIDTCSYVGKDKLSAILRSMSEEEVRAYVKKVNNAKSLYKIARKFAREESEGMVSRERLMKLTFKNEQKRVRKIAKSVNDLEKK